MPVTTCFAQVLCNVVRFCNVHSGSWVDMMWTYVDILAHGLGHHFKWPGDGGCHGASCGKAALRHHLPWGHFSCGQAGKMRHQQTDLIILGIGYDQTDSDPPFLGFNDLELHQYDELWWNLNTSWQHPADQNHPNHPRRGHRARLAWTNIQYEEFKTTTCRLIHGESGVLLSHMLGKFRLWFWHFSVEPTWDM